MLFRGFRNPGMIQLYIPQSVRDKAVPFRNTNVITDTQSSGFLKIIECTSNKHLSNTKKLGNKINFSLTGSDEKSNSISSRQPLIWSAFHNTHGDLNQAQLLTSHNKSKRAKKPSNTSSSIFLPTVEKYKNTHRYFQSTIMQRLRIHKTNKKGNDGFKQIHDNLSFSATTQNAKRAEDITIKPTKSWRK